MSTVDYELVLRQYRGFARHVASDFFPPRGMDENDLHQEAMIGLYKAARDYQSDRGSSFRNFADLCIRRQIITAIKTATRGKHEVLNRALSFDAATSVSDEADITLGDVIPDTGLGPLDRLLAREDVSTFGYELSRRLSPLEIGAVEGLARGCSYERMASEFATDTKSIDNALQRGRRKAREIIEEHQLFDAA